MNGYIAFATTLRITACTLVDPDTVSVARQDGVSGATHQGYVDTLSAACADTLRVIQADNLVEFLSLADAIKRHVVEVVR